MYLPGILISYVLVKGANVHATTATGDTALTYACENGHTDVADVLLQAGANLVCHESSLAHCPSFFDSVVAFGVDKNPGYKLFFRSTSLKGAEHP